MIGSNAPATKARDRVLSDAELAEIWRYCPDDDYGRILRLLMLTGQRRGEVAGIKWSEISEDLATWKLPAERVKNGRDHAVPLAPTAIEIIQAVPRDRQRDLLFGRGPCGFSGWGKPKMQLDARINAARKKAGAKPIAPWTVHDARRSVATGLGNLGIQPHIIEAALNHVSGHKRGVAGTYNKSTYGREVRDALLLWDSHVTALLTGKKSKIVAFPPRVEGAA